MTLTAPTDPRDEMPFVSKVVLKPIVDLQGAAALLGTEWDARIVRRDLDRRSDDPARIDWAWDIAGRDAYDHDGKEEVRVLASCVPLINRARRMTFEQVCIEIFADVLVRRSAQQFKTVPATFLARRLACHPTHILHLIEDGTLTAVAATRGKGRGRGNSPSVTWESVARLLSDRRI